MSEEHAHNVVDTGAAKRVLSAKVFGIPVVVFAVIGFAALLWYLNRNSGASDTSAVDANDPGTADTGGPTNASASDSNIEGDYDTSVATFQANPTPVVSVTATQDTNALWSQRVVAWLIANGTNFDLASTTIDRFLAGQPLTEEQKKVRNRAISQFGMPPEGVENVASDDHPPISHVPTKQFAKPPGNHTVTGVGDTTSAALAVLYYGRNGQDARDLIESHNASIDWSRKLPRGVKVHIPAWHPPKYFRSTERVNTAHEIAAKNGIGVPLLLRLNEGMDFPVKPGTRVRVQ